MFIPSTTERINVNTAPTVNQKIQSKIEESIAYHAEHPNEIDARLEQLNKEWDIERALETNAGAISVASVLLGAFVNRKWLFLPIVVGGFLLNHAVRGWCPPLPILRRMGIRTQSEIDKERYALKALRGDFGHIGLAANNGPSRVSAQLIRAIK